MELMEILDYRARMQFHENMVFENTFNRNARDQLVCALSVGELQTSDFFIVFFATRLRYATTVVITSVCNHYHKAYPDKYIASSSAMGRDNVVADRLVLLNKRSGVVRHFYTTKTSADDKTGYDLILYSASNAGAECSKRALNHSYPYDGYLLAECSIRKLMWGHASLCIGAWVNERSFVDFSTGCHFVSRAFDCHEMEFFEVKSDLNGQIIHTLIEPLLTAVDTRIQTKEEVSNYLKARMEMVRAYLKERSEEDAARALIVTSSGRDMVRLMKIFYDYLVSEEEACEESLVSRIAFTTEGAIIYANHGATKALANGLRNAVYVFGPSADPIGYQEGVDVYGTEPFF